LNQLERSTRELQSSVMNIRMLPISSVFNRVPRLIHDLGQKLNKKVELEIIGAETELDKTVLGKIGDPLVHLVRNSLDHGLEIPEKRLKKGKSEVGKLTLEAVNQVGSIIIKITDDGNGLNRDILFKKACEKGIANETDELTDEQVFEFIFHPGFSTAKEVSDVSGRGVGMDVVRRNIRALGGHVHVKSEYGVGTTFTMKLPLTMAILDGQLLSVGKQTYIIQLISIVESIQVKEEYIKEMAGQAELYQLRGEYISIIRLHEVFGVETNKRKLTEGLLVVVESDNEKIGLFIDDLMGQQQVVIKSLDTNFKPVAGVSGATILGDGTVSLILDVTELINMSRQKNTVYRSVEQSQVIEHRA